MIYLPHYYFAVGILKKDYKSDLPDPVKIEILDLRHIVLYNNIN